MRKVLLFLLTLTPIFATAQIESGYYRVQNSLTERYMSIVDTNASVEVDRTTVIADLRAIHMLKGFEDSVAYNPATICYIDYTGTGEKCNLLGQGLNFYTATNGRYLNVKKNGEYYLIYASEARSGFSVRKSLMDDPGRYDDYLYPSIADYNTTGSSNWAVLSVDQSDTRYFGIKPDVKATADNSYWSTLYAGFPFKASDPAMKTYIVKTVDNARGYAVIAEVDDVPAELPVLIRCAGETPITNKTTLLSPSTTASYGTNYLLGNYYCNDVEASTGHRNVKAYNPSTMRMLGTTADGKPAFVKSNISYLPANKCYLAVSSDAPDVLQIVTEAEYATGIHELNVSSTTDDSKVIYDLQGRRVTAPTKGLYIVNGKKVIIK